MNERNEARDLLNRQVDQETAIVLARGLIDSQIAMISSLKSELAAIKMDLKIATNEAANATTGYNLWRDIAHGRKKEGEALAVLVDELRAEVYVQMRGNHGS